MVDYGQKPEFIYPVETRVDTPMVIGGIKLGHLVYILGSCLGAMALFGEFYFTLIALVLAVAITKKLYSDEKAGFPTTHNKIFKTILLYFPEPIRLGLAPSSAGIKNHETEYRGF